MHLNSTKYMSLMKQKYQYVFLLIFLLTWFAIFHINNKIFRDKIILGLWKLKTKKITETIATQAYQTCW